MEFRTGIIMTTLAEITAGDQFLFACQAISVDPTNGLALSLYGPGSIKAADATIHPDGTMTGNLAASPDQVPVNVVTGFVPISVGDILESSISGETVVCRWSTIKSDGTINWSSSTTHGVVYSATGWTVVGHVPI